MKRSTTTILSLILLGCSTAAHACGSGPTSIGWKNWNVSSSEKLWTGCRHTKYPLTHLFDGDPRTAWVFSGTGKCWKQGDLGLWKSRYAVELKPSQSIEVDEVRIMNGYNRSPELFRRNNRIVQMLISVDGWIGTEGGMRGKPVKTVNLKDSMGWHSVSLPRQKVSSLLLSFTGIKRGRENDVCVSGIELYNRGRRIDMKMPEAVDFDAGSIDDGCEGSGPKVLGSHLMKSRGGEFIVRNDWFERSMQWSPTGRYACAGADLAGGATVWVADTHQGRVIYQGKMPYVRKLDYDHVEWLGNGKLALVYVGDYDRARKAYKHTTKKTIKFI